MTSPVAQTFFLMHNGGRGPFLADSETPSGYDDKPSTLVQNAPYEFIIDFYEQYAELSATEAAVPIGSVGAVYATILDSGIARVALTGATCWLEAPIYPGWNFNRLYVSIPVDELPAEFIGPDRVRLTFEIQAEGTLKVLYKCFLDVTLTDSEGETSDVVTITTANETFSTGFIDATGALIACPGPKLYLADSSPYAITITLPAYDAYDSQLIEIMAQSIGDYITVQVPAGVFLGTAETSFQIRQVNEVHTLLAVNDAAQGIQGWMHLNWRATSR